MPSKDLDIVAEVKKCGSRSLKLLLLVLVAKFFFIAVREGTSTSRGIFFRFFGFVRQETSLWYHILHLVLLWSVVYNLVFFIVFGGTLLRPTAGAVVSIRKSTTLQNIPWL